MAELNETMSVEEFLRWEAYDKLYPFNRDDLNFGRLLHLLASIYSPKGARPNLRAFLIGEDAGEEADIEDIAAKLEMVAKRANHED